MSAGAVLVAGLLDATLREPPSRIHPVRGIGRYLDATARVVPAGPPGRAVVLGGLAWTAGAGAAVAVGVVAERSLRAAPRSWRSICLGVVLWPLLSGRLLLDEATAVERALAVGLAPGRAAVARIVGRDVSGLSASEVRQAALESLGENLSDSVVAPLLWYAVGGIPAVALYRYANTADAMWGYRSPRWRYAGRVAARVDDLLNLVPARLTGLALAAPRVRLRTLRDAAGRTPSPNAGWPMAAVALRLGVRLGKVGTSTLNPDGRSPAPADTEAALRLVRRRGLVMAVGLAALAGVRRRVGP